MPRNLQELITQSKSRQKIQKATRHEHRLRLHTEVCIDRHDAQGATIFLDWVRTLIPEDKFQIFLSLFQFPAFTNELVGEIYNQLYRVFSGRNPAFNYQFRNLKLRDDWEWYREEMLDEGNIWRGDGWQTMKDNINSIIIVDQPKERQGGLAEPYFYFLPIDEVVAYHSDNGNIEWIIFEQDNDHVAYFDGQVREIYSISEKGEYAFVEGYPHMLNKCPARFFWTDTMTSKQPDIKQSPISKQLSKLDWLLFFEISKHHLDLYAPYPIYSAYQQDCDYSDPQTGSRCDGGFLRDEAGYVFTGRLVAKCPVCATNRLAGVGAFIEVPQPTEQIDMRKPVDITSIDRQSLDYNVEEVNRLKMDIFNNSVGRGTENIGEAINEMQVMSGFETKTSVLLNLKQNFEKAQQWTTDMICRERYGGAYLSASINLGTEFYVYTLKDLFAKYEEAKKTGASDSILDSIQDKIIEVENINNPTEMQRVVVLKHLEPFKHLTKHQVVELYGKKIITNLQDVILKVNFSSLIQRFERENTNVIEFASELEFDQKINIIKQNLLNYVSEETKISETAGSENGQPKVPAEAE